MSQVNKMMKRLSVLFLCIVCIGTYANSVNNQFHYDDEHSIVNNYHIRDLGNIGSYFLDPSMFSVDADKAMYRPLLLVSYSINYMISLVITDKGPNGGYQVQGYHVVNVLIHTVNTILVFEIAACLIGAGAFIGALLFAIHPLCSEPVNYISSRSESLAALFYLATLLSFIHSRGKRKTLIVSSWITMVCGLLCKATVVTVPIVILAYDFFCVANGSWKNFKDGFLARHIPYLFIVISYLLVITSNGFLPRSIGQTARGWWPQFLTQVKAVPFYVYKMFVPINLSVEPQFSEQHYFNDVTLVSIALVFTLFFLIIIQLCKRWSVGVVVYGWGLVVLTPVMIFPLNVLVNERRMYLSVAALCVGIGWLVYPSFKTFKRNFSTIGRPKSAIYLCIGVLIMSYMSLTVQRNSVWFHDFGLWSDAVNKGPLMPRAHLYLGNAYKDAAYKLGNRNDRLVKWKLAAISYEKVIEIDSSNDLSRRALNNLGSVHWELQDYENAEKYFREAVEANPRYADAIINLGSIMLMRARKSRNDEIKQQFLQKSLRSYKNALQLKPNHHQAHANLGVVHQDLGQYREAEVSYKRSLLLHPADWRTLKNLGNLIFLRAKNEIGKQRRESLQEARLYFLRSLEYNRNFKDARIALGKVNAMLVNGSSMKGK